jgi:hypothetical protein
LYWYNAWRNGKNISFTDHLPIREQATVVIQRAWRATGFIRIVRACARAARLKQELVMTAWHPQRMMNWCLAIDD